MDINTDKCNISVKLLKGTDSLFHIWGDARGVSYYQWLPAAVASQRDTTAKCSSPGDLPLVGGARGCHILIGRFGGGGEGIGGYRQEILSYIEYRICSSFYIFRKRSQRKMCRWNRYIFLSYAFCMRTLSRNAPVYGKEYNKDVTFSM